MVQVYGMGRFGLYRAGDGGDVQFAMAGLLWHPSREDELQVRAGLSQWFQHRRRPTQSVGELR